MGLAMAEPLVAVRAAVMGVQSVDPRDIWRASTTVDPLGETTVMIMAGPTAVAKTPTTVASMELLMAYRSEPPTGETMVGRTAVRKADPTIDPTADPTETKMAVWWAA